MNRTHEREDYLEWYEQPATPNQIEFMGRLGIWYGPNVSKGLASDMIDARLQEQQRKSTASRFFWGISFLCAIVFILACIIYGQE